MFKKLVISIALGMFLSFAIFVSPLSRLTHTEAKAARATLITDTVYLPIVVSPPKPPGVYLMNNHSYFVDSRYLYIVGEVHNTMSEPVRWVKVSVDLFDDEGRLVGTDFTFVSADKIPAGRKACFQLFLSEPPGWTNYQLSSAYRYLGEVVTGLTVFNDSGRIDGDGYQVIGQVRNDSGQRIEYVQPSVTLYNDVGTVIGCDYTYINLTHLDPGQVDSFSTSFYGRGSYADVARYQVLVDGSLK
ncbi:MAG: FxLYD domain-containing protein [Anaerolineae bacterium]|nr:FxLYD domain-containing protein [Anaerolineae bacterium]